MPYRRLPNTDSARLKALKLAIESAQDLAPRDKPFSQSSLNSIIKTLPQFERLIQYQKEAYNAQIEKSPKYNYLFKKGRNYVSHFIQVLNLAIIRGDLKKEAREFFNLDKDVKKLPQIKTEQGLLKWGDIVAKGEPERIANGGNPMTNPTIGVVKVHYENFKEAYRFQKNLQDNYTRASKLVADYRPEVDKVILQLWNEIEASFEPNSEVQRRNLCRKFGVVYFFRRNEIIPENEAVSEKYRKNRVVNKDLRLDNIDIQPDEPEITKDSIPEITVEEQDKKDILEDDVNLKEELAIENQSVQKVESTETEEDEETSFQYSLF